MTTSTSRHLAVTTVAAAIAVSAVVLLVGEALPLLAGWVIPTVLAAATAALVVRGRLLASRGQVESARALAGWAGVASAFALSAGSTLAGIGGGLLVALVAIVAVNAVLALWFRSPVHFAATQWLAFVWSAIAHVYGVFPLAGVVAALAGVWWTSAVGLSRTVVVSTTILIPLTAALAVHPLTHDGPAVDGADVATLAGLTALAVLIGARRVDRPTYERLWPLMRLTASVVLVAQIALGGIPAVAGLLEPRSPWPGLLLGVACLCAAIVVALLSDVRPRTHRVLEYCGLLIATVAAAVLGGATAATVVAALSLAVPAVVDIVLRREATSTRLGILVAVGLAFVVVAPLPFAGVVLVLFALSAAVAALGLGLDSRNSR